MPPSLATREDEPRSAAPATGGGERGQAAGRRVRPPAGRTQRRPTRGVYSIGVAVLTVVLSWTMVNTVYTLRYADLHYGSRAVGITFGDGADQEGPTYRDFAYVAFTIGMTYQVSDTTVADPKIRHPCSAAIVSYLFGGGHRRWFGQPHLRTDPLISWHRSPLGHHL